ncbi:MAG: class I SAM-dependent methyltransferase [Deltaproteobacteria bacterium]|nr:class I SAM-dependent methyltransferase [Deltaproteobacteria bacterium]
MPSTTHTLPSPDSLRQSPPEGIGPIAIMGLLLRHVFGPRTLMRRPEPQGVMNAAESVAEYNHVMESKLAISYGIGWETIHRARSEGHTGLAVDFCSGPGVFSLGLAELLGYERVLGVDLAPAMVAAAKDNAQARGLGQRVDFTQADVTRRTVLPSGGADLCTLFDAAHHFDDMHAVKATTEEMERITHAQGTLVLLDLARLGSAELTERYVNTLGSDYRRLGLEHFLEDFRQSMYAAWTVDELREAVPAASPRRWVQLVPRGLPALQMIIGLPEGRKEPFVRGGIRPLVESRIPATMHADLRMLRLLLKLSPARVIQEPRGRKPLGR